MRDLEPIDISPYPELQQRIEAVRRGHEPRILRMADETLVIITPITNRDNRRKRKPTQEDRDAFLASAGGWEDRVDTRRTPSAGAWLLGDHRPV